MHDNLVPSVAAHDALLGIAAVVRLSSLSKTTVYRLMRKGKFPESVNLTPGGFRVAWRESEVLRRAAAPLDWGENK